MLVKKIALRNGSRDFGEGAAQADQRRTKKYWSAEQDELLSSMKTLQGILSDGNAESKQ